jgi:hypothetical protein
VANFVMYLKYRLMIPSVAISLEMVSEKDISV